MNRPVQQDEPLRRPGSLCIRLGAFLASGGLAAALVIVILWVEIDPREQPELLCLLGSIVAAISVAAGAYLFMRGVRLLRSAASERGACRHPVSGPLPPTANLLSEDDFLKTFAPPMRDVTKERAHTIDIWPYVAEIDAADLRGHQLRNRSVEYIYRDATGRLDHVLVMTTTKNVYLVIVVDLSKNQVHGHHLLNLNEKYGVANQGGADP